MGKKIGQMGNTIIWIGGLPEFDSKIFVSALYFIIQ